jgi:hypothetical protein
VCTRYELTAIPKLVIEGLETGQLEDVTFFATSGNVEKMWVVKADDLVAVIGQVFSPLESDEIMRQLREGTELKLLGDYTPLQICELGFRNME